MLIRRFDFPFKAVFSVAMPKGAELLHIEEQAGMACLWAFVDDSAPTEYREFRMVGEGPTLGDEFLQAKYVGTLQAPFSPYPVAWHVFDFGGNHATAAQADGEG